MEKEDWKNILYEILTYDKVILSQKEKILDTIHPSSEVLKLIAICTKFSLLQDDRKMYNFLGDSLLEAFVTEFAKRTTFSVPDLKLLTHTDIIKKLETVDKKDLEARKIAYVFECTDTGISSLVGDKALQLFDYLNTAQDVDQSILHGVLASPGTDYYFRGIARVILDIKHINRLKEGEILVTTMTSPDFVVGMKKAGAIVTDTGGILSHAAIVSRELRKPCIVGTGIATKVIKDGDIVELHCGRGTVKVIKNH